jgi:UDP-N-acetylglucosamine/UDP-N-acetylgalactosamine diphosphorylase
MAQLSDGELHEALASRNLESVFEPAKLLGPEQVRALTEDLRQLDWQELDRQRSALAPEASDMALPAMEEVSAPNLAPPSTSGRRANQQALALGEDALRAGRVAVVMVAGGQASRLGFDGPKGAFPIGALTGSSLFHGFAGQLQGLRQRYEAALPWVVQTGPGNHEETMAFFQRHAFFGLPEGSVHFVCQGTLPALSPEGQLLLSSPSKLFRNPDGHGGLYRALHHSGLLPQWEQEGIDTVYTCQVDNPLVRLADPIFLGHHLAANAEMSVKVVEKTDPREKVGLVVRLADDTHQCLEYSDLSTEIQEERAEDGGLLLRAGNIAIHAFSLPFLKEMAANPLPLHLARKEVLALSSGEVVAAPRKGVKFETFIFDALPRAKTSVVQLVEREEEFAPVKNRSGVDSITSSRAALIARDRRWCKSAAITLPEHGLVELFPGTAYEAADLVQARGNLARSCGNRVLHKQALRE